MFSLTPSFHANTHPPFYSQDNSSYFKDVALPANADARESDLFENRISTTLQITNFTNATDMGNDSYTEYAEIPYYIKATSMTFCIVIMCLGVIGNVMVPIVILKTKDMRNSTNIFLVNLSIADLMVLLVCTPTVLVEVNSKPETWVLGKELCLAVPFVELTVAHASVLTILAISFERYYAICEPLRAGYVCTKTRAALICALAWFFAALTTSPILAIAEHRTLENQDGLSHAQCLTQAVTFWPICFFVMIILFLYILPLIILIILYTIIARNLISAASKVVMNKTVDPYNVRARKQVILMLGTVVLCFFVCLMPYRILALWIIITPTESSEEISPEKWYNLLYFSRIMLYINSAVNPILYNLMSSKFRLGFCKMCICYNNILESEPNSQRNRINTLTNGSTTSSSLTRTTNSLKKLFYKNNQDKVNVVKAESDTETEVKSQFESENIFVRVKKRFVRQHSDPIPSTAVKPKLTRMKSDTNILEISTNDLNKDLDPCTLLHSEMDFPKSSCGSLRRSVLMNTVRSNSGEVGSRKSVLYQKVDVDCAVAFKSNDVDCNLPESFV